MKMFGRSLVSAWLLLGLLAPWLSPYAPTRQFEDHAFAPPTRLHLVDTHGPTRPYFHPAVLEQPLERRFGVDLDRAVPLRWLHDGHLFDTAPGDPPFLLLGADSLGRDAFSRLLLGARLSLALALLAVAVSLAIGSVAGLLAGYHGGLADTLLMRLSEFVVVLPALYVLLALRAALPLVLPPGVTFVLMAAIFGLVGWPVAARGVRAIVAAERDREYVQAAVAMGASAPRILLRHLWPATTGFLRTQAMLLLPAFVVAEATLSFAGLGLPDDHPGWGTLLQEAANIGVIGGAPWLLAPAVAVFTLVAGVNLALEDGAPSAELADVAAPAAVQGQPSPTR